MTAIEANKAACRKFYSHLSRREFAEVLACVSDDVVWWVQGNLPVSGTHHGKAGVERLLEPLKIGLAADLEIKFGELTAEEDRVALEMESTALLVNGKTYRNTYHFLFWIRDGKIVRAKEYLDTQTLAGLLSG